MPRFHYRYVLAPRKATNASAIVYCHDAFITRFRYTRFILVASASSNVTACKMPPLPEHAAPFIGGGAD